MMSHTPLPGGGGAPMKPNTMVDQVEPDIKPATTIHANGAEAPIASSMSNFTNVTMGVRGSFAAGQPRNIQVQQIRPTNTVQVIRQTGPNQIISATNAVQSSGASSNNVHGQVPSDNVGGGTSGANTSSLQGSVALNSAGAGGDTPNNGLTPDENSNVTKCKNFLVTLIQLAQRNEHANPRTVLNVKNLVQQLIDDKIQAEEFTERLQRELQSTPQPYLVPFLRKSLPLLRRSMQNGGGSRPVQSQPIQNQPGIKRPPSIPQPGHVGPKQFKPEPGIKQEPGPPSQTVRGIPPRPQSQPANRSQVPKIQIRGQPIPPGAGIPQAKRQVIGPRPGQPMHIQRGRAMQPNITREDDRDEYADVTVMANVNLENESKMMTQNNIGQEIRHAGDEPIAVTKSVLHKLVGQAASRAGGIERVTPDGARLIGLALEEYVKGLVSKAIHAASHRNIQFKDNEHRIKINDVKAQFKYLTEVMHEEKKKAEEAEQEQRAKLLRSRNKKEEDPEREKKKKDAKLKQQELAEKQQLRQADQTALEASKRKRPTTTTSSTLPGPGTSRVNRVTRVKMRDILFCLESERLDKSSRDEVYKRYLK